jgi:molybdopterin/thiamine biosynthesis adenylyltransferase
METKAIVTAGTKPVDKTMRGFASWFRGQYCVWDTGEFIRPGRIELLYHSHEFTNRLDQTLHKIAVERRNAVVVLQGDRLIPRRMIEEVLSKLNDSGLKRCALLYFMTMRENVTVFGWLKDGQEFLPIDMINIPGKGMLKMAVHPVWPLEQKNAGIGQSRPQVEAQEEDGPTWLDTRDRLAGFMGWGQTEVGEELIHKIATAEITVIGAGRMGDCTFSHLVKFGAGRIAPLNITDGDTLEPANLDSMEVPYEAVGMNKADVLAAKYSRLEPGLNVNPIPHNVSDAEAVEAVIRSEYVFGCVDNNPGRTGVAFLTGLYNRVHFDFAGGGAWTPGGHFSVGGEVRCAIPGCRPCVNCMKGDNWRNDMELLSRTEEEEENDRLGANWRDEKGGSCKAVVSSVAGNGMMLFIRLLQGRLDRSVHQHFDSNGILPKWTDWTRRAWLRSCHVCGRNKIAGLGDLGIEYGG